jgi:hypothetical protein
MQAERGPRALLSACSGSPSGKQRGAGEREAPAGGEDVELSVVRGTPAVGSLVAYLRSGEREHPVVAIARSLETGGPVLDPADVRVIVGVGPRIYYLPDVETLEALERMLGRVLALPVGGVRVWWPGLSPHSRAGEHPVVLALDGEPHARLLAEFAREFDLSRPRVRGEIGLIEDLRRLAERELSLAREQNRNMKIERHDALTRAEEAEARLREVMRQLEEKGSGQNES